METIDLLSVCRGIQGGDKKAFKTLFYTYFPRLLYYACRFVDKEAGEDIVQDVFVYVWENRRNIVMGASFPSFLYKITYNKVINVLKHRRIKFEKQLEIGMMQKALAYYSPYDNPVFDKDLLNGEFELLRNAVNRLPEKGRLCIQMRYVQGLSVNEIAGILHLSPRTVETHLYKSVKAMREMYR